MQRIFSLNIIPIEFKKKKKKRATVTNLNKNLKVERPLEVFFGVFALQIRL